MNGKETKVRYPLILLTTPKDFEKLSMNLKILKEKFLDFDFYVIGCNKLKEKILSQGCCFLDEDAVMEGLNIAKIRKLLIEKIGNDERAGWYFQQFLKMAVCYITESELYLIWDGDTVPLKEFSINPEELFFDVKTEYHKAYFDTLNKLFPCCKKKFPFSFISEHMIIKTEVMKQLIEDIEKKSDNSNNIRFYERIIDSINTSDLSGSGFSEFETYGNYTMEYYPNLYKIRYWTSLRGENDWLFPENMKPYIMKRLSKYYDAVSFDDWQEISKMKNKFFKIALHFMDLDYVSKCYQVLLLSCHYFSCLIKK